MKKPIKRALRGENSLYASFSEGRETFISNMGRFGLHFESMRSNRVEILDFITSKEPGVDAIMEMVTKRIEVNCTARARLLLGPLLANSLTNGMGVLLIPTCGQDADCVINWISEYSVDSEAAPS